MVRLALLGAGKIGEALLAGLVSAGWTDIVATSRREERLAELRERYGVDATASNLEAIAGAKLVVIAVKPQDFEALLGEIAPAISEDQTVLSVAARPAIPSCTVEGAFGIARTTGTAPGRRDSICEVLIAAATDSTV